jgi:hypothetical protein
MLSLLWQEEPLWPRSSWLYRRKTANASLGRRRQAKREGKTLDAWLISVARESVAEPDPSKPARKFESVEELRGYLRAHSALDGPERELDWDEHLRNMDASIRKGLPDV